MIRISIVGLGLAVEPHAQSLLELQNNGIVEVRWAASPSERRTSQFAERYPFPVTNDVQSATRDTQVDAVFLLTPPSSHLELAREAFAHGKHVLVEKPLDISVKRAREIVEIAKAAKRCLGVVLQCRFRPAALRLTELMKQRALGKIQAATLSVPWWRPQRYYDEPGRGTMERDGGGVLMTQAIHSLDLFRSLLGPVHVKAVEVCTTELHRMETEDLVMALLRLRDGAAGTLMATTACYPGYAEQLDIIGSLGTAQMVGSSLKVQWLDGRSEEVSINGATGAGEGAMDFPHGPHKALISDFLAAMDEGRSPLASGEEALATQQLITEFLQVSQSPR